jgi:hypothetical protein
MTKPKKIYFDSLAPDKRFKTYDSIEIISHPSANEINMAKTNEPIYPPTPIAEIVCAKCAKAFKYVSLMGLSVNEDDEQIVDNLMNKANKDLEERSMKTQISNFELADRLEKNIFLSGEDDEADDYLLEIASARLRQIEDLKDALEDALDTLEQNKPNVHDKEKIGDHWEEYVWNCPCCEFEEIIMHIKEVLEETK